MSASAKPSIAALRDQLLEGAKLAMDKALASPTPAELPQLLLAAAAAFTAAAGMRPEVAAAYDRRDRDRP